MSAFVEVPWESFNELYEQQTKYQGTYYQEQFFKALLENRVSLVPTTRQGAFRVSVTPPVQDASGTDPNQQTFPSV